MPLYALWGVSCNACGADQGFEFFDQDEAASDSRERGWYVGEDGTVLCPDCDGENE
jgi:hypothetical protein